jgi:hypothetical protein
MRSLESRKLYARVPTHLFEEPPEVKTDEYDSEMSAKEMYCNNCGEKGHVFRTCKDPIILVWDPAYYEEHTIPLKLPVDPRTVGSPDGEAEGFHGIYGIHSGKVRSCRYCIP